jgi:hypothetical protein
MTVTAQSTTRSSPLFERSALIDAMFGLTIAALFAGVNQNVGLIKIQLSDILAAATIFLVGLRSFSTPRASTLLLVMLSSYLLVFSASAFFVGATNGIKEIVQVILVFSFVFVAFGYYRTRSTDRLLIIASGLIFGLLVYNIGWHVAHDRYVGWKELNEPKTIFTLIPLLLILLFNRFGTHRHRFLSLGTVAVAAAVILLSGERKAYIFAIAALAIWTTPINWRHALGAALVVPLLLLTLLIDRTGYLDRQLTSFADGFSSTGGDAPSLSQLLDDDYLINDDLPTTLSNAQREVSNRLAVDMWEEKPLLGIGTNAFAIAIEQNTSIPARFRNGIHGEFYRALYENGIIGFGLYLAFWIVVFARIALAWPIAKAAGDPSLNKVKLLCATMFLVYCTFEASKGLTLACICALPFIVALPVRSLVRNFNRYTLQPQDWNSAKWTQWTERQIKT